MIGAFVTAFIIYFVVIEPVSNAPIFLAVTQHQDRSRKPRNALEGTAVMLFFALCDAWILSYLKISEAAFRIAGGIILFLVALDMLAARRQQRKREATTGDEHTSEPDNVAIYPLAIPLLAGPSAIMSVIVVTGGFASGGVGAVLTGYAALLAVMVATGVILSLTVLAEGWMNEKITMVFSRITAIILAGLSVQYVIDGLATIGLIALP
jgi:multiple antibiotic resistance protein